MATKTKAKKNPTRYFQEYKTKALALAEKVGVSTTAKQLGIHEAQLCSC